MYIGSVPLQCDQNSSYRNLNYNDNTTDGFYLRQILRIRWPDTISNEDLWRRTQHIPIPETIKERKWRWVGHTLRQYPTSITRQALDWNPQGKHRRGRPTTTWRRSLDTEPRTHGISWGEAKHKAQDRSGWKIVVKALCPGRKIK